MINKFSQELGRPGSNSASHTRTWQHGRAGPAPRCMTLPFSPVISSHSIRAVASCAHAWTLPPKCLRSTHTPSLGVLLPLGHTRVSGTQSGAVVGPFYALEVGLCPSGQEFQGAGYQEGALGKPFPLAHGSLPHGEKMGLKLTLLCLLEILFSLPINLRKKIPKKKQKTVFPLPSLNASLFWSYPEIGSNQHEQLCRSVTLGLCGSY